MSKKDKLEISILMDKNILEKKIKELPRIKNKIKGSIVDKNKQDKEKPTIKISLKAFSLRELYLIKDNFTFLLNMIDMNKSDIDILNFLDKIKGVIDKLIKDFMEVDLMENRCKDIIYMTTYKNLFKVLEHVINNIHSQFIHYDVYVEFKDKMSAYNIIHEGLDTDPKNLHIVMRDYSILYVGDNVPLVDAFIGSTILVKFTNTSYEQLKYVTYKKLSKIKFIKYSYMYRLLDYALNMHPYEMTVSATKTIDYVGDILYILHGLSFNSEKFIEDFTQDSFINIVDIISLNNITITIEENVAGEIIYLDEYYESLAELYEKYFID